MSLKSLTLELGRNVATVKSPSREKKAEFQAWKEIKYCLLKSIVAMGGTKRGIAVSPADDPSSFEKMSAVNCVECAPPHNDCYLLTAQGEWPTAVIQDLASSMSFSLGQLWFFETDKKSTDETNDDIESLVAAIERCTCDDNYECTTMELFGCVADDAWIVWHRPNVNEMEETLKTILENAIRAATVDWQVISDTPENCPDNNIHIQQSARVSSA